MEAPGLRLFEHYLFYEISANKYEHPVSIFTIIIVIMKKLKTIVTIAIILQNIHLLVTVLCYFRICSMACKLDSVDTI